MITIPTVFIIGAGASAEYGFPLGHGLVQNIVAGTAPEGGLSVELLRAGFTKDELNEFNRKLRGADPLSIDTFLEGNGHDRFQEIGKAAIAISILRAERYSVTGERWLGNGVPADHWLRYVWNLARSGCSSPDQFANNRLSFVTFNYDRTVEWYFQTVLESAFNLVGAREAQALFARSVPVVHLHGEIAGRDFGQYEGHLSGGDVTRVAAGIRIVSDAANEPQFKKAWYLFQQASLICILGFGYHPVNIERLRLNETFRGGLPIAAGTFGMGQAEVQVAQGRIRVTFDNLQRGIDTREYKAERFLREAAQLV